MTTPSPPDRPLRILQWGKIRWWNARAWYLVTLADALARRGHASFVGAPEAAPLLEQAHRRGLPVAPLGDLGSADPVRLWAAVRRLRRYLVGERIDVVVVHSGPGHLTAAWAAREAGIPIVRVRGDIRAPRSHPWQRRLYRDWTDLHLVAAEFLARRDYPRLGVDPRRVRVLRGGVDLDALAGVDRGSARREVRARLGLPLETLLVGMVARLSPVKGHDDVLAAFAPIGAPSGAHLLFVGPDAQLTRTDLSSRAGAFGIADRTHIVGRVDDPWIWAAALDIAIVASIDSEAICRSAFEYLGLGVPLIGTRLHAIEEVLTPGTGKLVPPHSPPAIREALSELLASSAERAALAEAGPAHIRAHYTLDRFAAGAEAAIAAVPPRAGR